MAEKDAVGTTEAEAETVTATTEQTILSQTPQAEAEKPQSEVDQLKAQIDELKNQVHGLNKENETKRKKAEIAKKEAERQQLEAEGKYKEALAQVQAEKAELERQFMQLQRDAEVKEALRKASASNEVEVHWIKYPDDEKPVEEVVKAFLEAHPSLRRDAGMGASAPNVGGAAAATTVTLDDADKATARSMGYNLENPKHLEEFKKFKLKK